MNPEEYMPLREVVFMTLRRQILKGELKPGERLMEINLANRLGVSRTPVREAIRKLEHEGLVEMVPRRGAHVAEITRQELNDVLEIRRSLETLAISRVCGTLTEENLRNVEEVLAARELAKFGVLKNCDDDPREIAEAMAQHTGAEVVQVIGKKIILYREGKDDKKKIELPRRR